MWRRRTIVRTFACLLAGAALAAPALARAQAFQCSLPREVSVPEVDTERLRRLPVTGYTLALSWAPEFCRFREDDKRHARQCSGREGRFGFTVHGLWPESGRSWPQWCGGSDMRAAELRKNLCISPDARLVTRQWEKHGTCMANAPATYLKVTRILYNGLRWPDFVRISREDGLTAGTIRTRLADANPGWFPEAIGVHLDRKGWLEELRLCYDKRFMPKTCEKARFGVSDDEAAKIWRGL
ncbi:ribonuclease T [Qipengyuania sp. 1NDH17]|uniref:Ribonuclease T n=1 Tax=Qipengyuania polymorpha TaxID=2867234 RepID=A0ABS7IYN8_9SPHN|nr:ribonuclease T [Qipengyuania polymorpha]MBX7458674.1 ribonuclease T [Qipengyuania polymorpha]